MYAEVLRSLLQSRGALLVSPGRTSLGGVCGLLVLHLIGSEVKVPAEVDQDRRGMFRRRSDADFLMPLLVSYRTARPRKHSCHRLCNSSGVPNLSISWPKSVSTNGSRDSFQRFGPGVDAPSVVADCGPRCEKAGGEGIQLEVTIDEVARIGPLNRTASLFVETLMMN